MAPFPPYTGGLRMVKYRKSSLTYPPFDPRKLSNTGGPLLQLVGISHVMVCVLWADFPPATGTLSLPKWDVLILCSPDCHPWVGWIARLPLHRRTLFPPVLLPTCPSTSLFTNAHPWSLPDHPEVLAVPDPFLPCRNPLAGFGNKDRRTLDNLERIFHCYAIGNQLS